jgi:hypothetical protein
MSRRSLLLFPAMVAAIALPVAPALAGEDDPAPTAPSAPAPAAGSASLHVSQCVGAKRARVRVTGTEIAEVTFFVDGERVKTVTEPNSDEEWRLSMKCSTLSVGAHRGRAAVSFEEGASPTSTTLRFQVTRARQGSPRFTG